MKTKKQSGTQPLLMLKVVIIPLLIVLIIAITSCSGSKKVARSETKTTPVKVEAPSEVFVVVEEMPSFPGGNESLMKFMKDNIRYPEQAKNNNITGMVVLRFVVSYIGTVDNVQVLKSVDPLLDAEAVRVVKMLPAWQPGKQGGKQVNVWYTIPVTFGLSSNEKTGPQFTSPPRFIVQGNDTVYLYLKDMPQFPGGQELSTKFKNDNIKYPIVAKNAGFGGIVTVSFIVAKDGSLSDFSIMSGVSPSIDAEALRVARLMPAWIPAKENGKPVKAKGGTSFYFDLNPGAPPSEVFVVVEEMPRFPGGDSTLMKFIYSNLRYPEEAKTKNIQGRVILRFCVNYMGNVEQVGVLKSVDPALDYEAIRVIKSLPQWNPGKQGGKPVNTWYSVPVTFSLPGQEPQQPQLAVKPVSPPPPPPVPPVRPLITGYDEPPLFPGGEEALVKFIEANKKYPQEAKDRLITGKVVVRFSISETGIVEKPSIFLSADRYLDTEAIRVINLLPSWKPGKLKGIPVPVYYSITFNF